MYMKLTKEVVLEYQKLYHSSDDLVTRVNDKKLYEQFEGVIRRGYMTLDDLVEVGRWKFQNDARSLAFSMRNFKRNDESHIRAASRESLSADSERERIEGIMKITGVRWSIGSAILHFAFPSIYPILDKRAMATVNGPEDYENFEVWIKYVKLCRKTAAEYGVSMRILDYALWMYDSEKKNAKSPSRGSSRGCG